MEEGGFTIVKRKSGPKKALYWEKYLAADDLGEFDIQEEDEDNCTGFYFSRADAAATVMTQKLKTLIHSEIATSHFSSHVLDTLRTGLKELSKDIGDVKRIVCYGLGSFLTNYNARLQFALLSWLKGKLGKHVQIDLYDPILTEVDKNVIRKQFGYNLIRHNEEGNRMVDELTIFYLPHCPHGLCNNILRSNWGDRLVDCVILGNRFSSVCARAPKDEVQQNVPFILDSYPCCMEFKLNEGFKFQAFNDLAIHVFPQYEPK